MSTTAFHRSPFIEWGVATQPIPGETVCGDLHLVKPFAYGALVAVAPDDLLMLSTDGIRNGFDPSILLGGSPQKIADRVMSQHFKGNDDGLVLVVRFLGTRSE